MLALLLDAHDRGHPLELAALQEDLRKRGQSTLLNRSQLARLLTSLREFLALCPGVQLQHLPRHASTGPWSLHVSRPLRWSVEPGARETNSQARSEAGWAHARLLSRSDDLPSVDRIHRVLSQTVTAEAFSKYGNYGPALDVLRDWDWTLLSAEARAVYRLRQVDWTRRAGLYAQARQLATSLIGEPAMSVDPQLGSQARHQLRRIDYDEAPGQVWSNLLASPQTPGIGHAVCWQTQSEWHNLQALAWRRAAQDAGVGDLGARAHDNAVLHMEAAIYGALRLQNWDRLHAYIDNLAFHLQKMLPLGLVTVRQVYDFYALSLACADKLDSGEDDLWDLVYFGEFWLDHAEALSALVGQPSETAWPLEHHPQDQGYWSNLCEMTSKLATPRVHATALLLYSRWAQLQQRLDLVAEQHDTLRQFFSLHPEMAQTLAKDGYAPWLPERRVDPR